MPPYSNNATGSGVLVLGKDSVKFDEAKRHAVYLRDGYKCSYSGYHDTTHTGVGLSIDHLVARNLGGEGQGTKGTPGTNLTTASMTANRAKSDKSTKAFNAFLQGSTPPAGGLKPIDFAAIRQQSSRKLDLVRGAQLADLARQAREHRDPKTGATLPGHEEKLAEIAKQSTAIVAAYQATAKPDKRAAAAPAPEAPKGAPREAKPEHTGPGIQHGPDGKFMDRYAAPQSRRAKPAAKRVRFAHLTLARACEASAPGEAPTAFRILAAGENVTDKGPLVFTPRSARLVMQAFHDRGNPLALYYEHEDRLPLEARGGAPMRGVCAAPSANLAVRDSPTGPELWAEQIAWTDEAKRQIKTGERRQISPVAAYDEDSREVLEILNVSLCAEGATHSGTLLASRSAKGTGSMDELIQQMEEAIDSMDWEALEALAQQAEAAGGDEMARMAKMARAAMKAGKGAPPHPPKDTPSDPAPVATKRLAANRYGTIDAGAFSRGMAQLESATGIALAAAKRSDRATVQTLIAANRDCFDVPDEREHLSASDPAATERHVKSMRRKLAPAGDGKPAILAASREGAAAPSKPAMPPKDEPKPDPEASLTVGEKLTIEAFNRGQKDKAKHITAADFAANKAKIGTAARGN
jgi:hypothetical protein